ncbi:Rz-like spanin [Escherichia phage herni]|uniref:RzlA n=1 Tax=Escherichia phage herni TaxID=2696404 RepID=A0A6B9XE34_9CAUD|nr:Rz-like spanin [Escherichia phage herni]QHR74748.1 RzlA [Escherichia phage herni]
MRKLSIIAIAVILSGCSSVTPLTGLIGSKPEITAQAGSENVKQAVGVTAKQDTSTKQETTIKESAVDKVDTSSKKDFTTSTIHANTIKADKIQVVQGEQRKWYDPIIYCAAIFSGLLSMLYFSYRKGNEKEA